jgi:3-(3-hydroxy-phenyl)propionate hydroxylase
VVGCGPVGAVLALRLQQLGLRALVVERSDELFPLPRAVAADDEVQEILDRVSPGVVGDMLVDQAVRFVDARRRPIGTIDFPRAASGFSGLAFFAQPLLEASLRRGIEDLRLGVAVESWTQDGSGVTARLSDGSEVVAGWLVGCDGASSSVRSAAGIAWRGRDLAEEWLVVDVRSEVAERRGFTYTCDPAMPQVDMPVPGGHRWEWLIRGDAPDVAALIARDTASAVEVVRAARYRFGARRADRWVVGRVALAGDAAHTMPPFAGQGLGAGVRDAWALAERIASGTVDGYQAQRAPHVRQMTRLSLFLGAVLQTESRAAAATRDALLRKAFRAPALGPWLSRGGPRSSTSGVLSPVVRPSR